MRRWIQVALVSWLLVILPAVLMAQDIVARGRIMDTAGNAVPDASVPQTNQQEVLSGTVVDPSGAVTAGATVLVRSADGAVQRTTRSDSNDCFTISGLPAGNYRLVVSNPGF
jgi:Carboxypeptidase regulatory-like domain